MNKKYSDLTQKSRSTISKNASKWIAEKRAMGEKKQLSITGDAEEIDFIRAQIAKTGKSNIKGLMEICQEYAKNH